MTKPERIAATHRALGRFIEEARMDPAWLAERDRTKTEQVAPTRNKESIVRTCVAGAIKPEEALEIWKRVI